MIKNKLNTTSYLDDNDTTNPMDGVSNMSDAMLVLAVGIMLALVINWKVDLKDVYNSINTNKVNIDDEKLNEIDMTNAREMSNMSFDDLNSKFKKSGEVYTDVYTGKTYIVTEN